MARITRDKVEQIITENRYILDEACPERGLMIDESRDLFHSHLELWHAKRHLADFETNLRAINYDQLGLLNNMRTARALRIFNSQTHRAAYHITKGNFAAAKEVFWHLPTRILKEVTLHQSLAYARGKTRPLTIKTKTPTAPNPKKLTGLSFPHLRPINHRLDDALSTLQKLWRATINQPGLTDEDRFLLIQTVTTYLPDAWRMYTNLDGMPINVTNQAADLLHTQVITLTERIQAIRTEQAADTLKDLRAQTNFINGKKSRPRDPQLDLR